MSKRKANYVSRKFWLNDASDAQRTELVEKLIQSALVFAPDSCNAIQILKLNGSWTMIITAITPGEEDENE